MISADRIYSDNHQGAQLEATRHHRRDYSPCTGFSRPCDVRRASGLGRKLKMGEQCGVVESVKSASDIYAPIFGEVTGVNGDFATEREKNNHESICRANFFKLKPADESEWASLLNAEELIEAQVA